MQCFVISLPGAVERREHIREQFAAAGIRFSFFDAIDLRRDRNRYLHHCDDREFLLNTGRTPSIGEIGCYASHLMLWRNCRLLNEPLVIFEDDAGIHDDLPAALRFVSRHIRRLGFVRLQDNFRKPALAVVRDRQRTIAWGARYPHGSMAYALSPQAADAFIRHGKVFDAPVDVFVKRYWMHGQALYTLTPAVVRNSEHTGRSTIAGRGRSTQGASLRARRWCRKRRDFLRRAVFAVRLLWRHLRGRTGMRSATLGIGVRSGN